MGTEAPLEPGGCLLLPRRPHLLHALLTFRPSASKASPLLGKGRHPSGLSLKSHHVPSSVGGNRGTEPGRACRGHSPGLQQSWGLKPRVPDTWGAGPSSGKGQRLLIVPTGPGEARAYTVTSGSSGQSRPQEGGRQESPGSAGKWRGGVEGPESGPGFSPPALPRGAGEPAGSCDAVWHGGCGFPSLDLVSLPFLRLSFPALGL